VRDVVINGFLEPVLLIRLLFVRDVNLLIGILLEKIKMGAKINMKKQNTKTNQASITRILMEKRGKKIILKPFFFFIIGILLLAFIFEGGLI
jgi:hypothetical protein